MKNVLTLLAKGVLISLDLTTVASTTDAAFKRTFMDQAWLQLLSQMKKLKIQWRDLNFLKN